jgi:23S rRNA pseudouridine955/2504/2580 synthase
MNNELSTVSADEAEIRLDRWLRRRFPKLSQGQIQKWCRTGQLRVDGRRVEAGTRLKPGQAVRLPPLPPVHPTSRVTPAPPLDRATQAALEAMVLYCDEAVIALAKPAGLPVQGGAGITRHLDAWLDGLRFGAPERPRLVHRLDRETSGVMILARSPGAAAKLAQVFRSRMVKKVYWSVVWGRPEPFAGEIDLPLVRSNGSGGERVKPASQDEPKAAPARTHYRTLDTVGQRFAWLELSPLTGRTHQLRVHCAALGVPILGDALYGPREDPLGRRMREGSSLGDLPNRLHLHARRLVLPHPLGGVLELEAELPPHMQKTFHLLGFKAPPAAPPRRLDGARCDPEPGW